MSASNSQQKAGGLMAISNTALVQVAPGVHKVDVYWKVDGNTYTTDTNRVLTVEER
jgi:hypothetical protein